MFKKILISLCFIPLLVGCVTTKYVEKEVPVETVKTEYIHNIKHDSIYIHNNIYSKGDTVYKEKLVYKSLIQRDTVHVVDSIPYIVRVTETTIKEINKLKWYQRALNVIGVISLLFLFIYVYRKVKR